MLLKDSLQKYEEVRQFQLTCFTGILEEDMEHIDENTDKIKSEIIEHFKRISVEYQY